MNLIIIGAGGFGREVAAWAEESGFRVRGFLDDTADPLGSYAMANRVLGSVMAYEPRPGDRFVIAIGSSTPRMQVAARLAERGFNFTSVIHPTAIIAPRAKIGEGAVICPQSVVSVDARLGRHVIVNLHSTVGHDTVLGDGCTISAHCDITGFARLGEGVFMGSHAGVAPKVVVGDYAVIGAGAIAVRNVPARATVFSPPPRMVVEPDDGSA